MIRELSLGMRWLAAGTVALAFVPAAAIAQDRAYELVSPSGDLARVLPGTGASAPSGDVVCFDSENAIAGADSNGELAPDGFCSRRTASGWDTKWVTGPPVGDLKGGYGSSVFFVSPDGNRAVFGSDKGIYPDYPGGPPDGTAGDNAPQTAFMWEGGDMPRWLAPTPEPVREPAVNRLPLAASEDLSHGLFQSRLGLLPEDTNADMDVYEWTPDGIRLVSRDASGAATGGSVPPNTPSTSNAVSALPGVISRDGSRIFFERSGPLPGGAQVYDSVYMREGDRLEHVSPRNGDAPRDVDFAGASDDGEIVYLETEERLTSEPKEAGKAIYRYDVASGTVSLVATDPAGVTFLGLSGDGSTIVYHTSRSGFDSPGPWELRVVRDGITSALGMLDFQDIAFSNFTVGDPTQAARALRISRDGDVVAFSSLGSFDGTPAGTRQVYRWTPQDGVSLVSAAPGGGPSSAGADMGNFSISFSLAPRAVGIVNTMRNNPLLGRSIAADGRVFFETSERLVSADVNDYVDVYEWHDGTARLISPGTQSAHALYHDNSADGKTAFFVTSARIIPELDRNTSLDLYAARVGGGFPLPVDVPCEGDRCQGPPPPSPPSREKGSVSFSGPGNVDSSRRASLAVGKPKASGGTVRLRVRVPAAGRLSVSGARVRNAIRSVGGARTVAMKVGLKKGARRTLAKRGRLSVQVRVSFTPRSGGSVSRTVRVVLERPKAKRAVAAGSIAKGGR